MHQEYRLATICRYRNAKYLASLHRLLPLQNDVRGAKYCKVQGAAHRQNIACRQLVLFPLSAKWDIKHRCNFIINHQPGIHFFGQITKYFEGHFFGRYLVEVARGRKKIPSFF